VQLLIACVCKQIDEYHGKTLSPLLSSPGRDREENVKNIHQNLRATAAQDIIDEDPSVDNLFDCRQRL